MQILRSIGAVVAGLIVGMVVNGIFVTLNTVVLFPAPPGTDMNDAAQMNTYIAGLPVTAFLVVLVAHLGQSFVGGWVAARLAASRPMVAALVVGALSLVGGILNMLQITLPSWMLIELPLYLVVAWAAGRLEVRRRSRLTTAPGDAAR